MQPCSLLPVSFHPTVAELCLQHKKHLVTASYISPAMRDLHERYAFCTISTAHNLTCHRAVAADVLFLNEIGLDPGIEHCSAISLLSKLQAENKRVTSFTSFCGGLPAPEHAEGVPLKYKFSWSPRGVLGAALNGARFKLWGEVSGLTVAPVIVLTVAIAPGDRGQEYLEGRFPASAGVRCPQA